jgi:hypothetical protein
LTPAGSTESTEPCGGAATVSAVVHASPAGGLSETSGQYDVEHIVISATDPHWAVAATIPHPDAQLQGAQVILYCTGDRWTVTDLGSSDYGCNDSPTGPAVPADVRADLGVQCTGY